MMLGHCDGMSLHNPNSQAYKTINESIQFKISCELDASNNLDTSNLKNRGEHRGLLDFFPLS